MLIGADGLVRVDLGDAARVRRMPRNVRATFTLPIAGSICAVHFGDAEVARWFHARYADVVGATRAVEQNAFVFSDELLGPVFWSDGGPVFCWPHGSLPPHITAFLADAVAMAAFFDGRTDGAISLHAASVGAAGSAAAIVADSNGGKTTTAVACARAGLQLYGDERCIIDARTFVHPFARSINLRAAGNHLLLRDVLAGPDPVGERLRAHGEGDWEGVRLSDLLGTRSAPPPLPLRAVFLLAGHASEPRVEPASALQAAKAAARWTQGAGADLARIARLLDLFSATACYRLTLGTPHASACAIAGVLETLRRKRKATA
jgi:hypothetical protein